MGQFVLSKKVIIVLIIITLPLWLPLINNIFSNIFEAGKIIGTNIRTMKGGFICL